MHIYQSIVRGSERRGNVRISMQIRLERWMEWGKDGPNGRVGCSQVSCGQAKGTERK